MRLRYLVIGVMTLLLAAGAVHWTPLWMFVVIAPVWLDLCFTLEEERVRVELLDEIDASWRDTSDAS